MSMGDTTRRKEPHPKAPILIVPFFTIDITSIPILLDILIFSILIIFFMLNNVKIANIIHSENIAKTIDVIHNIKRVNAIN